MNQVVALEAQRLPHPTLEEPIPSLVGAPGWRLLRSASARMLVARAAPEDRDLLTLTCKAVLRSLSPATGLEAVAVVEALALHYPVLRRTDAENRVVARQWIDDLAGWPLDLLQEGARLWRNSPAERFPTAGQFKATVATILRYRQALGRWATAYLAGTKEMAR